MKISKLMVGLLCLGVLIGGLFTSIDAVDAYVSVKGYYRKDGTYVRPHVRSNPNGLKYDNYSWKPSDGLYNDSYGTRGSTWDTPTYITDPDYYEGKRLYESGQSGSSYTPSSGSGSTYAPSYGSYSSGTTCPANSTYSYVSKNCQCNYGYVVDGGACKLGNSVCSATYGSGATYDALKNTCVCGTGYDLTGGKCVPLAEYCKIEYGTNAGYDTAELMK